MTTSPQETSPLQPPLHFNALLTPHRSLSPKGFVILMCFTAGVSFSAGMAFVLMGAWPVMGFFGLDVALIYGAFKLNNRAARAQETVQVSDDEVRVRHIDAKGRVRAWGFHPHWVRVQTQVGPDDDVAVALTSHGRTVEIARLLSPGERRAFAGALKTALSKLKN